MAGNYDVVFNFGTLIDPLTKLVVVVGFFVALSVIIAFSKVSMSLRAPGWVVSFTFIIVAVIEFAQTASGYGRIRNDFAANGAHETEGVFKVVERTSTAHAYQVGGRRFEVSKANYPALEP